MERPGDYGAYPWLYELAGVLAEHGVQRIEIEEAGGRSMIVNARTTDLPGMLEGRLCRDGDNVITLRFDIEANGITLRLTRAKMACIGVSGALSSALGAIRIREQ